ncbi:MAG: hypothetical protein J6J73_01500 [Agathobacter sp.]|nr:hypothetical protein [Agathobacter sp.]
MGILMMVFLQKLIQMKKQVDKITQEVSNYIAYVTEDIEENEETVTDEKHMEISKNDTEEAKNRIIQAVLKEYFP